MKKLFCMLALLVGVSASAQAQVYFNSGSDRPNNPAAAQRDLDRPVVERRVVRRTTLRRGPVRRFVSVRCRDGSRHTARGCRRHGRVGAR